MRVLLSPRSWAAHLLAVVAVAAAGLLGVWQFESWRDARAAEAREVSAAEPVALDEALGPDDAFGADAVGQPVTVRGRWLPGATVLVSGREQEGERGSWVVTPVVSDSSGSAIYVVRGFTTADAVPGAPSGAADLVVLLQPPEGTGEVDEDAGDDVLPQLRTADLVQRQDEDLYGGYAVIDPERSPDAGAATAGLEPATPDQLPAAGGTTALRNVLYAVEWWIFGAFALLVWSRWARDVVAAERAAAEQVRPPVGENEAVGSAP